MLHLVEVIYLQDVRWEKSDTELAVDYTFFSGNGNNNDHTGPCLYKYGE
jgi:hypothetical protein